MAIAAAPSRGTAVSRNLGRARADLQEETALIGGLARTQILDFDRIRRDPALVVEDLDLNQVWSRDLGPRREAPNDRELPQAELAEHPRDDDHGQQHSEQQVEQVVARVDCRKANAKGNPDEVLAFAGEF